MGFAVTLLKTGAFFFNGMFLVHIVLDNYMELLPSKGESMLPTLNVNRDYLFISKRYRLGKDLRVGDMVATFKPTAPEQKVCKRITGMEGDYVLIDPSKSSITTNIGEYLQDKLMGRVLQSVAAHDTGLVSTGNNEEPLKLHRLSDSLLETIVGEFLDTLDNNTLYQQKSNVSYNQYIRVPEGHCWVTGDNLSNSIDSRTYNCTPLGMVAGKVVASLYVGNPLLPWTWKFHKIENIYLDAES